MEIKKVTYTVYGLELVMTRRGLGSVEIKYNDGELEWGDIDTHDVDEVWVTAEEIYQCSHDGTKGTRGDVDEIYRAIMAFEV